MDQTLGPGTAEGCGGDIYLFYKPSRPATRVCMSPKLTYGTNTAGTLEAFAARTLRNELAL